MYGVGEDLCSMSFVERPACHAHSCSSRYSLPAARIQLDLCVQGPGPYRHPTGNREFIS
jgi:hypothetical protein